MNFEQGHNYAGGNGVGGLIWLMLSVTQCWVKCDNDHKQEVWKEAGLLCFKTITKFFSGEWWKTISEQCASSTVIITHNIRYTPIQAYQANILNRKTAFLEKLAVMQSVKKFPTLMVHYCVHGALIQQTRYI